MADRFASLIRVLVGAVVLIALPLLNGRPLFYNDTRAYYALGGQIAERLGLAPRGQSVADLAGSAVAASPERERMALTTAAARSPYYSFYLFVTERLGGLWLTATLQVLVAAWLLFVVSTAAVPAAGRRLYYVAILLGALATTLPFFAGYAMPDAFTGLGILASVGLMFYSDRIGRANRAGLVAVLLFSVLAHSTHVLNTLAAAAIGAVALRAIGAPGGEAARRAGGAALVGLAGLAGAYAYGLAGRALYGEDIRRPPFIMARVLEDGPGLAHLRAACAGDENAYELCRHRQRGAISDSQHFLWDKDPENGVFGPADYATRVRLIDEERRFVLGAVLHDPIGQLAASARNVLVMLGSYDMGDVVTDIEPVVSHPEYAVIRRIVPGAEACAADPRACPPRLPVVLLAATTALAFAVSVPFAMLLACRAFAARRRAGASGAAEDEARAAGFVAVAVGAVLVNAALCAALSGPFPRYHTRMTWLVPLALATIWTAAQTRSYRRGDARCDATGLGPADGAGGSKPRQGSCFPAFL